MHVASCRIDRCALSLFHELPAGCMFFQQFARLVEFQLDLDLLEAHTVAHQHLADEIIRFVTFVFHAQVVVQIDAAFDHLTAAIALYRERIKFRGWSGWERRIFF